MIPSAIQTTFDHLYPFSFATDKRGQIITVGRSLHKLSSTAQIGTNFLDSFIVRLPMQLVDGNSPAKLIGELVFLVGRADSRTKLRGQVVCYDHEQEHYIFNLDVAVASLTDFGHLGLNLSDFRIGDPILDFLLYMKGQQVTDGRLHAAKANLEWENDISKLLLSIALDTQTGTSAIEAYSITLATVCKNLPWKVGHIFIVDEEDPNYLVFTKPMGLIGSASYGESQSVPKGAVFKIGEGLPGRVWERAEIVWSSSIATDPFLQGCASLYAFNDPIAVAFPIIVDGEVVAVLEFLSERAGIAPKHMERFFELLAAQLSAVVARLHAEEAARHHLAGLASASKMATLGEIAAGVAHEINNPLHTLTLTSHLIKRLGDSNKLTNEMLLKQLATVETCVQRMAKIVAELKAFSRDSSHDAYESIPVFQLIEETLDLCHARIASKDVLISVDRIPEAWTVECRRSQISQVILNLVNNSYDAIANLSERWIKIEAIDKGAFIDVTITDSGHGIPEATAKKIMAPFFTTKAPGVGTGLGLSISSNIMTDHGGTLVLDRECAHTRFIMRLPKNRADYPAQDPLHLETTMTETTGADREQAPLKVAS